jgi:hypothetical protein
MILFRCKKNENRVGDWQEGGEKKRKSKIEFKSRAGRSNLDSLGGRETSRATSLLLPSPRLHPTSSIHSYGSLYLTAVFLESWLSMDSPISRIPNIHICDGVVNFIRRYHTVR